MIIYLCLVDNNTISMYRISSMMMIMMMIHRFQIYCGWQHNQFIPIRCNNNLCVCVCVCWWLMLIIWLLRIIITSRQINGNAYYDLHFGMNNVCQWIQKKYIFFYGICNNNIGKKKPNREMVKKEWDVEHWLHNP